MNMNNETKIEKKQFFFVGFGLAMARKTIINRRTTEHERNHKTWGNVEHTQTPTHNRTESYKIKVKYKNK